MGRVKRRDITDTHALALIDQRRAWQDSPVQLLQAEGFPFKVVLRKLEHLADRGLIDYGVSLHYPWLTREGREALAVPGGDPQPASPGTAGVAVSQCVRIEDRCTDGSFA